MEDAYVLAEELRAADSVEHALERYVSRRKARVTWVQQTSRAVGEGFALAPAVRNALLCERGDHMMQQRYAPLTLAP